MANINFGILDTQSPAKIGNAFIRSPEQQNANMLQAMQMQGLVNQNELAQSQLRAARRAEEGQALLGQAYAGANFGTGGTAGGMAGGAGQSPYPSMRENIVKKLLGTPSAYLIPGELAKITEMENKETTNREAQGKVEKQARDAVDYTWKQYQTEVPRVTDAAGVERWTRATHRDKLLGPIVSRFKTEDQAVADAVNLFNSPGGANKWATQNMGMSADKLVDMLKLTTRTTNLGNVSREVKDDFFGNLVGSPVDTPIGVSPNTTATLKQAQDHFNSLSAFQKRQLEDAGWSFDTERGIAVNARRGISQPISTLMTPVSGGGAPAVQSGVPMVAPTGGVPGQRQAPAGQAPAGQPVEGPNVLGPKPADTQKTEIELNKQYTSESKGFIETKLAIDKAKAALRDAATNPTAGLSAGTAFMKILDPASVVRETELAMALKSSGWFDRVTNIANTLQSGKTILTPTQITNLNKTIDGLFEEVKAEQRIVDSGYARRAKSYGLDVRNIITDRGQNKIGITEQTPPNAPPIQSFRPKL